MALHETLGEILQLYVAGLFGLCLARYAATMLEARFRYSTALCAVCCAAARALLYALSGAAEDSAPTALRGAIMIAVSFLMLLAFFRVRIRRDIYAAVSWGAVFDLSFFAAYCVVLAADPLYGVVSDQLLRAGVQDLQTHSDVMVLLAAVLQLALAAVLTALCVVSVRRISRDLPRAVQDFSPAEFRLLVLPAIIGVLLTALLRMLIVSITDGIPMLLFDQYPPLRVLIPAIAVVALVSVVYAARTCGDMARLEEQRRAGLAAQERAKALRNQVIETERMHEHVRKMRHDLRNTFTVIRSLSAQGESGPELAAYLDGLAADVEALEPQFVSGEPVADVLLSAKARELAEAAPGAHFDASAFMVPSNAGVSAYDLGIILGNALDNAIEAVRRQADGKERFVRLRSFVQGDLLGFTVENSCTDAPAQTARDGLPESTGAPGHGIGMRTIRDIAAKYCGTMDWKKNGEVFTLAVMLRRPPADSS